MDNRPPTGTSCRESAYPCGPGKGGVSTPPVTKPVQARPLGPEATSLQGLKPAFDGRSCGGAEAPPFRAARTEVHELTTDGPAFTPAPSEADSEFPPQFCPVCSKRLESWRCKMVCPCCGYFMSCSEFE